MKHIRAAILRGVIPLIVMAGISLIMRSQNIDADHVRSAWIAGLIIAAVSAASVLYQVDAWSLKKKSALHFFAMLLTVYPCLLLSGWFPVDSFVDVLKVLGMFLPIGLALWCVLYIAFAKIIDKRERRARANTPEEEEITIHWEYPPRIDRAAEGPPVLENLLALSKLLGIGLIPGGELLGRIDCLFAEFPGDALLLELEWCLSDTEKMASVLHEHAVDRGIDGADFGRALLKRLEGIYARVGDGPGDMDIREFARIARHIWSWLPQSVQTDEPFYRLLYADEPLAWSDEAQARALFEGMFRFFDAK